MSVHAYNPRDCEAKGGGSGLQGRPSVHIMLEAATGGPLRHNAGRRTTEEQRSVGILGYTVKVH